MVWTTALIFAAVTAAQPAAPPASVVEAVKAKLKDPDSAKFKDVKATGPDSYCGWVNAKNSFGGYTGFQLFYDTGGSVEIIRAEYLRLLERFATMEGNAERLQKVAPCRQDAQ